MNNGKICVSVCAATADELIQQIKRAEDLADVIEIRLDCVQEEQFTKAFAFLTSKKPMLLTYRPETQGGKVNADSFRRKMFWDAFVINENIDAGKFWFDYEFDLERPPKLSNAVTLRSFHDFSGVPANLEDVYKNLSIAREIPKVAVQADDITETIPVWKLLTRAKSENKQIIPIAMGEAGKWTRILGLAHGAFMTYAALEAGSETAPGQISADDLTEVYRVKELNEQTEVYGIIGGITGYSMSPYIHDAAFKFHDLNAVFVPLQVNNLDEFMRRMVRPETREIELNFKGFAVTMPHKQNIIKHLDEIDESAEAIGAVNTVKIENGKFYGYNTDAHGFIEPLINSYGDLKNSKVAIFGAGGAARAAVFALKRAGALVTIFARDLAKAKALADDFQVELKELTTNDERRTQNYNDFDILVNSTPLGRTGKYETETPFAAEQIESVKLVYDLNYSPFQTRPMTEADQAHVPKIGGLAMLIAQAIEQQRIWTALKAPMQEMSRAALERLS